MRGCSGGAYVVLSRGGIRRIRRDTVNERAVRILLECILVGFCDFLGTKDMFALNFVMLIVLFISKDFGLKRVV